MATLLGVLNRLRAAGDTLVIIEHNMDVIKTADWIIDLGQEGGRGPEELVAEGTPEDIAAVDASHTGECLRGCSREPSRMEPHNEAMFLRSYIYSMKDAHPMPIRSRSKNSPVKAIGSVPSFGAWAFSC